MIAKHTPGPWKVGTSPPNGEQTIGTHQGLMVAVATTVFDDKEQTIANARLIAAAPELLDLLKEIFDDVKQGAIPNLDDPWHEKTITAIAKATGTDQ
jgi:hypothetical protein